ncbi:MAG: TorF family putative porin [Gemmatimonadales bacterium]
MQRAKVGGAAFVLIGALAGATPGHAQATFGVDLDLFSSYVWRGLSLTNKPVAEPGLWVSFPAGNASITVGGWANIDLGKYDDIDDDISESGGTSSFNLSEFDPYAEISFPAGKATLTGGVTGYIYPNDLDAAPNGGLDSEANTVEIYGKVGFDVPLSPELSVYYDVDKIKGAYIEANLGHSLAASEAISIDLGATAGFSAGQGVPDDVLSDESFNFADDGFTHLDLSVGVPFSAGAISITPVIHVVIAGDDATKVTSPSNIDSDTKLWGGVSLSWSNEAEEEEPEAPASPE